MLRTPLAQRSRLLPRRRPPRPRSSTPQQRSPQLLPRNKPRRRLRRSAAAAAALAAARELPAVSPVLQALGAQAFRRRSPGSLRHSASLLPSPQPRPAPKVPVRRAVAASGRLRRGSTERHLLQSWSGRLHARLHRASSRHGEQSERKKNATEGPGRAKAGAAASPFFNLAGGRCLNGSTPGPRSPLPSCEPMVTVQSAAPTGRGVAQPLQKRVILCSPRCPIPWLPSQAAKEAVRQRQRQLGR